MAYSMSVAVFDSLERLLNDVGYIPFSHGGSFPKPIESVHTLEELCDEVKVLSVLKHLEDFNNIRVGKPLQRICFRDKVIKFIFREANFLYSLYGSNLRRVCQLMAL
jgi:hypothetical protein